MKSRIGVGRVHSTASASGPTWRRFKNTFAQLHGIALTVLCIMKVTRRWRDSLKRVLIVLAADGAFRVDG
jgi:hypothetical protein